MTGRRSPERNSEQSPLHKHPDATSNQFFDVTLGRVIDKPGGSSFDSTKNMDQPQPGDSKRTSAGRNILLDLVREEEAASKARLAQEQSAQESASKGEGAAQDILSDLFRKEEAASKARLAQEQSAQESASKGKAAETMPEAKRTQPADNLGSVSRGDETRPIDLNELGQIIAQAPQNREGAALLAEHYTRFGNWIAQNQTHHLAGAYQQGLRAIDAGIKERTKAALQDIEPQIKEGRPESLRNQSETLKEWLARHQRLTGTAIYQLNQEVVGMINGEMHLRNLAAQLAQTPYAEGHHQHLHQQRDVLKQWFEHNEDQVGTETYRINEELMRKFEKDLQAQEKLRRETEEPGNG